MSCSSAVCAVLGQSPRRSQVEFDRSFALVRALPCDVPLGDHPAQYDMTAKHARLKDGTPNPFIDKANCLREVDVQEAMYHAVLDEQQKAPSRP